MIPQDRVRVVVSEFEENLEKGSFKDPRDYAIANAEGKAREVRVGMATLVVTWKGTMRHAEACMRYTRSTAVTALARVTTTVVSLADRRS